MALKTIRLYGKLGAIFGRVHRYDVSSASEAIKALSVTIEGFQQYLMAAKRNGMAFTVLKGKRQLSGFDELKMGVGREEIRIAPIIIGSKRGGLFQTILGAALMAVAIWMPGVSIVASNIMFGIGASLALGGVYQLLSPQPKGLTAREDPDNRPSYAFGGPVNTAATGVAVGLLYGRREIGGAIISAGIMAEDI